MQSAAPAKKGPAKNGWSRLGAELWKHRGVYLMLLPGITWYAVFVYGPMGGLTLAFKEYSMKLGVWGSPWVGLENFGYIFRDAAFMKSIGRTLSINLGRLIFEFPMPVIMALLLNEIRLPRYKKTVQTIMTFPNFLSWIIVASIMTNLLSMKGPVNNFLTTTFDREPVSFLGTEKLFQPMLYITSNWKGIGWNAIIYLAAISGIDMEQYEAAEIDGATRFQRMIRITIPNILPTVSVMFILSAGSLMSGGFDQIFNLSNAAVKNVAEILDMYIYRITFQSAPDFGFSTAVSLFRSVVNMILLIIADRGSKLIGGSGLFR